MNSIEIITFNGCQNALSLIAELEKVKVEPPFDFRVHIVPSSEKSEEMGLHGSPTILLNGREYQKEMKSTAGFY